MNIDILLNAVDEGVLIVDAEGRITFFNDAYAKFINCRLEDVRGRKLTEIRPGARMPEVLEKGEELVQVYREQEGKEYFANIYPIKENGKIVGGVSVVTFLENAKFLAEMIGKLNEKEAYLNERMKEVNGTRYGFESIVYGSDTTARCIDAAKRIAHSDIPVLIQGESGCGKELYAQSIHNESDRRSYPFVAVNCAVLTGSLLESELFGYEDGSFTGAKKGGKAGLFEIANKGTLFLDEVSEMDYGTQAKLLRALQEQKIRRVGGTREIDIDVRIIGACNVDIMRYIEDNKFRRDLYYRIAAVPLQLAPLRERRGDIGPLIDSHLANVSISSKKTITISREARNILINYDWPGNVRELKNVLEYSTLMMQGKYIDVADLPPTVTAGRVEHTGSGGTNCGDFSARTLSQQVKEFEKRQILATVERCGNSLAGKKEAAKKLGISLATLYNKIGD